MAEEQAGGSRTKQLKDESNKIKQKISQLEIEIDRLKKELNKTTGNANAVMYTFIKKETKLQQQDVDAYANVPPCFRDVGDEVNAGVPENHRVGLAISCLRGTAADWASIKEDSFPTFTDFEHAFIKRYWGMTKQRDLFLNLSDGRHESGSLSEYSMNLVNQANFLTERIPEEKLTKTLSKHFPSEIQRGIVTMGLKIIDEIDEYLREVDDVRKEAPVGQSNNSRENTNGRNRGQNNECVGYTNEGSRGQGQGSNWRSQPQGNSYAVSNEGQRDGNVRQVMSHLTTFNDENDFLSNDSESEEVSEQSKFKSPILRAKVGSVQLDIIADSGSEISAVSEKFFDGIKQYVKVPVLPVSGLAISPAFDAKRQRIKWQILLSIQLLSHQNIDLDVKCLVIPGLNCDILFGCDWLASFKASIDFQSSKVSFSYGDEAFMIPFHSEVNTDGQLSVNLCSSSSDILEEAGVGKNSVLSLHRYSNAKFKIATSNADTDEVSRNRLENVLLQYSGVFSENPGCVKSYVHRVEMEDESPFNAPLYPIPFIYREEVKTQMKRDFIPPPNPSELLLSFKKGVVLSTIDLTASYWQILARMKDYFYWPKIQKHIRQFKVKPSKVSRGLLNSVIPEKPGELVCLDLIGPLPTSRGGGGVTQLLVVIDAFTKYVRLYPLKRATTRSILNKIMGEYVVKIQKSKCLLSDNGTQFTSKKWGKELVKMGIQIKHISVYFPEGNITEQYNREVGRLLRMYCHEKHSKWACVVDFVEDCLNMAVSVSTAYSPRYLQFGTENEHPVTKFIKFPTEAQAKPSLQSIWVLAHDRMTKQAERRALKHAAKITPIEFCEGDKFLMRMHAQSSAEDKTIKKFFHLYVGPFGFSGRQGLTVTYCGMQRGKRYPSKI
nr:unnamed protein product [Callosobruchus chinensis]